MTQTRSKCYKCKHDIEYGICVDDLCGCVCSK